MFSIFKGLCHGENGFPLDFQLPVISHCLDCFVPVKFVFSFILKCYNSCSIQLANVYLNELMSLVNQASSAFSKFKLNQFLSQISSI